MQHKGRRFNSTKTHRPELIPQYALDEVCRILTDGAHKYTIFKQKDGAEISGADISKQDAAGLEIVSRGDNNWRFGMSWTKGALGSLKRHLSDWEKGLDIDPDDGQLLMAKIATNALFLTEWSKTYPQGDDRWKQYLHIPKIGLDIDDVLADFIPEFAKKYNLPAPTSWNWSYKKDASFADFVKDERAMDDFYSRLSPLVLPEEIPFEPVAYITSRTCATSVTKNWIEKNGFPPAPVITVGMEVSKVEAIKNAGIEVFVDDRYDNFVELNNAGICCYLFDSSHNRRHNVGNKRIKSLSELPWFKD